MNYSFTCPLEGCNEKMTVAAHNKNEAIEKLSAKAKQHLEDVHPDIHKSDEEIEKDITLHLSQES